MKLTKEMIDVYLLECSSKRLSKHTLKAYRIDLKQACLFFGDREITKTNLLYYIEYLNGCYKAKTVKRKLAVLHALLEYLVYDEKIDLNPMDKIRFKVKEEKRIPRIIKTEDLRKLVKQMNQSSELNKYRIRDKAVIELLIGTGVRVSELCSLKKENIDFEQQSICVNGKGSKERMIYLGDAALAALSLYYCQFETEIKVSGYFFMNNIHHPITDQNVRYIINKYTSELDVHITPHMFRHTFATLLLEQDVDIAYIQKILGHSSITTTTIYAYVSNAKQKEIMRYKNPRDLV